MDIQDLNPSQVSEEDAKDIGRMLVDLNSQGMEYIQGIIVGPSIDNVMANEGDYSKIYKPIIQKGRDYVTQNQLALERIDSDILSNVNRQIALNTGQVTNFLTNVRGSSNVGNLYGSGQYGFLGGSSPGQQQIGIGEPLGTTGPISSITGQLPIMPIGSTIPIGNGSTGVGTIGQVPVTQVTSPIGQSPPTGIGITPSPIGQPTPGGFQPIQGVSTPPQLPVGQGNVPTGGTFGCTGITAVYGGTNNGDGTYTCPAGTMPHYNASDCTVTCVPIPGYQPPQPTPQPPCPVLPPPPPPPPPISPTPTCPKPTAPCPPGYDYWWNPKLGGWQCVPGGVEPKPLPPPEPILPSCQDLMDRLRLDVSVDCKDLPKDLRKRMVECGYLNCDMEAVSPGNAIDVTKPEWAELFVRIALAIGWIL